MARARDPNRDKAFEIWKKNEGNITNREIAQILEVDEKKVAVWKQRDKWNVVQQTKNNVVQQKEQQTKKVRQSNKKNKEEPVIDNELTDKQRLFCFYYLKYFNATKAYQKAYECDYMSAMSNGSRLLRNDKISAEIDRLKAELANELKLDVRDVLQKYIDIAFADITDFVEFGREEVTDDLGNPFEVNRVKFKESSEVDGTLITEVKQGKDGVSVKLADKMKALDFLAKYTDLLNENELKQLKIERERIAIRKENGEDGEEYEDDGFLDALKGVEVKWDE